MAGAVLCAFNTRHDSAMLSVLRKHSKAKVILVDYQFFDVIHRALYILSKSISNLPHLFFVVDEQSMPTGNPELPLGTLEYENLLAKGNPKFEIQRPKDEWHPIALNYTSGTTSCTKGVVYSHRGAYLNSLATISVYEMLTRPVYLWTVPMFHCNGWCFPWVVAAQGGTNICLRNVIAKEIFSNIVKHKVTLMFGAPTILNMIINTSEEYKKPLASKVLVVTGGAPPPPCVIFKMEELGFEVAHGYGLTKTYGPATVCVWNPEWDALPPDERAKN